MAIKQTEQREAAFKHVANILHSSINRSADAEQLESRHPAFSDNLLSFVPAQSEAQFNLDTKIKQIRTWVPATTLADGHNVTVNSTNAQKLEAIYSGSFEITHVDDSGVTQNGARVTDIEGFQYVEKVIMPLIMDDQSNGQLFLSLDWTSIRLAEGDTSSDSNFTFNFDVGEGEYPFTSSPAGYLTRKDLRLNDWLFKAAFGSDYNQETRTSVLTNWNGTGFGNTSLSPAGVVDAFNGTEYFAGLTFNPTGGTVFAGSPDTVPPIFKDFFGAQQELPLWIVGYRYIGPKGANLLQVLDDGVQKTSGATKIDFTGGGVTVTNTGTELTVNIPGSDTTLSGGGGISSTGAVGAVGFYSAGSQISGHAGFVFDNDPNSLFLAGDMTMSGILSASSGIISKLEHSNGVYNNVVTYDTTTGRLFYTESYGTSGEVNAVSGIFNDSGSAFVTTNNLQVTGSVKIDGALSIPGFDNVATTLTTNTSQIATNVTDIANATNRTLVNYSNIENLSNLVDQPVKPDSRVQFASVTTNQNFKVSLKPGSASFDHLVMTGDIIPFKGHIANLGSREKPWKELYISGKTIYFISGSDSKSGSADHKERGRIQIDDNANFAFLSGSNYREMTASHLNITNGDITINEDPAGSTVKIARGSGTNAPGYISSTGGFGVIIDSLSEAPVAFTVETNTDVPGESGTRLLVISESGNTTINGDLTVNGTVEALIFTGDGSGLTGIAADSISATAINHLALTSSISGAFAAVSNSFSNRVTTLEGSTVSLPANLVSSSAQIASEISGAFTISSASFSSRVTAVEGATVSLPANLVSSSAQLADDISGSFNGVTSSFITNSQTASFITNSQTGSFLTSIPGGTYSSSLQTLGNITSSGNIKTTGDLFSRRADLIDDESSFLANGTNPILTLKNIHAGTNADSYIKFESTDNGSHYSVGIDTSRNTFVIGSGSYLTQDSSPPFSLKDDKIAINVVGGIPSYTLDVGGDIRSSGVIRVDTIRPQTFGAFGTPLPYNSLTLSSSVTASGNILALGTFLGNNLEINNNITASGNVSASGTIIASNLSGTNTGDQDLSSYIQNSQTGSFLNNISNTDLTLTGNRALSGSNNTFIFKNFGFIEMDAPLVLRDSSVTSVIRMYQQNGVNYGDITAPNWASNRSITLPDASGELALTNAVVANSATASFVTTTTIIDGGTF